MKKLREREREGSINGDWCQEESDVGTKGFKTVLRNTWVAQWLSASLQPRVILESHDQVPHRASCMEPASPSACVSASLSLCLP